MKKIFLTMAIALSSLVVSERIQGQDAGTNPDQMKLMQQFLGEWKTPRGQDTVMMFEIKQVGEAFVETDYLVTKDKKWITSFWNYSYIPEKGKFVIFVLNTKGKYYTYLASFISEKEWIQVMVPDFAADKIIYKDEFVFLSSSEIKTTSYSADGKKMGEGVFTRVR